MTAAMSKRPRYVEVTSELRRRVETGEYAVGTRLPTETQLTEEFDVSRSTIRQALAAMEEAGLIDRRQGSGTRVLARRAPVRYVQTAGSEGDILRYAAETVLDIVGPAGAVSVSDARRLHLGDPDQWVRVRGVRRDPHVLPPLGITTLYVRASHADAALRGGPRSREAIFAKIAQAHSLTLSLIEQEITATLLTDDEAEVLDAAPGGPALAVVRRYHSEECGLFEVAESVHPADRFSHAVRLERERSPLP
jgi:DNA-binding GntR family transcriptional regulator